MKKSLVLFVSLSALSLNTWAQGTATTEKKDDPVVATVNGVEIKKTQFDQAFEQNMMFVSDKMVSKAVSAGMRPSENP